MTTDPEDRNRIGALQRDVARLKNQVEFLLHELKLAYPEPAESPLDKQIRTLLEQNKPMDAMRVYREATGASLSEAKTYVEKVSTGGS
jgi:ribosomal protein L7/L12